MFGDECKGATVDFLARFHNASLVVRFNGGPQNSHNVTLPDGKHHTFRQFGSATFIPGVRTHLSEHVLINPIGMMVEDELLRKAGVDDAFARLTIDANAVVITPYQRSINVLTEIALGRDAHGSCGVGLGIAREDSIRYPDEILRAYHLWNKEETISRLKFIEEIHSAKANCLHEQIKATLNADHNGDVTADDAIGWFDGGHSREYLWDKYSKFPMHTVLPIDMNLKHVIISSDDVVIFEGSQGILLDESNEEFAPHTTWTDTTYRNAISLIDGFMSDRTTVKPKIVRIGCLRPYVTRHGAGPLPRESVRLTNYLSVRTKQTEYNKTNRMQGHLRYGHLDNALVRKAIASMVTESFGGLDQIAMSCLDHLITTDDDSIGYYGLDGKYHQSYHNYYADMHNDFITSVQKEIGVPITILGYGPAYTHRFLRITD
jgi:adenylosuccinate synthase